MNAHMKRVTSECMSEKNVTACHLVSDTVPVTFIMFPYVILATVL